MHRTALAGAERWTIRGRTRTRTLENRLARHRTSRSRTHGGASRRSWRGCWWRWPQRRFVNRPRPGLRNDHSWRRNGRRRRRTRCHRPGSHSRRLCRRCRGPRRNCCRRARNCRRRCDRRNCGPRCYRSRWSYRSRSLRRGWRRGRCKSRSRSRGRNNQSWWRGWRCRRWRGHRGFGNGGRRRRCGYHCRLRRWHCGRLRSIWCRDALLLADDRFKRVAGLGNIGEINLGLDLVPIGTPRAGRSG